MSTNSTTISHAAEDLGRHMLQTLAAALGAEGGSFYFVREDGLQRLASLDPGHAPGLIPFPLDPQSPLGMALTEAGPILSGGDIDFRSSGWSGYQSDSFLVLPVSSGANDAGIAAIVALHDKSTPPFTENDRNVATLLARCCAGALGALNDRDKARRAETRLLRLLDTSSEAILILDAEQSIIDYSAGAEELFGYAPEEVIGRPGEVLIPDRFREGHKRYFAERLASGDSRWPPQGAAELRIKRHDGTERGCEVRIARVEGDGVPELIVCLRDISANRRLTERLQQRELQLVEAQRLEGAGLLAESISDDLLSSLRKVQERTDAVYERVVGDDVTTRHIEQAKRAATRATELATQLGSFAEPPEGEPSDLDINAVLTAFYPTFGRLVGERVTRDFVLQPDLYGVRADRANIEHILANLALHCRETLVEGTHVTLQTMNVRRLDGEAADGRYHTEVHIIVEDDGPGLSDSHRERLLGAASGEVSLRGRELGLAVVFALVHRCGGAVEIDSHRGRGTRFEIRLPALAREGESELADFHDPTLEGRETVLLVDEDGAERRRLAAILKSHGYKVIQAGRAEEALQLAEDFPDELHMLCTHHRVRDMGGAALVERVLAIRPETVPLLSGTGALSLNGALDSDQPVQVEHPAHPALFLGAVRSLLDHAAGVGEAAETEATLPGHGDS